MGNRPSHEAKSLPAHHKIPLILWNPGIRHKKDILGSTLSQKNLVHMLNAYILVPLLTFESRGDAFRHVSCPSKVALNLYTECIYVFIKTININSDYFCKRN
jgi:hypothetical protein